MSDHSGSGQIRTYRDTDRAALFAICVRTADAGGDARGLWASDDLMPDLFAWPYVLLAPQLSFVLEDAGEVVGYMVGTSDTPLFAQEYRERYIPLMLDRYPVPDRPPVTPDEQMIALHHGPERLLLPELAGYPAHL